MAVVLDSTVFIEAERRKLKLSVIRSLAEEGEDMFLAAITASELLLGVHLGAPDARQQERAEYIEDVLESFPILIFDLDTARKHSGLMAQLRRTGSMIGLHDLLIGATALTHGFDVITHNLRDFQRIPGLIVRQPTW